MIKDSRLSGIYPITPDVLLSDLSYEDVLEKIIASGINIFQFRIKSMSIRKTRRLFSLTYDLCIKYNVLLIINNNIELAKNFDDVGLHIGDSDINISEARKILGNNRIIGISCYNSIKKALNAQANGANYVSFGSMFPTKSKKRYTLCSHDMLEEVKKHIKIPICVIGGINHENIKSFNKIKPDMISMISGIFSEQKYSKIVTIMNTFNE